MTITTINPATAQPIQTFELLSSAEIERKLALASRAFLTHRRTSFEQRAQWMNRAAELLEQNAPRLGALITQEMGKPVKAAEAEVTKCAWVCRYYAENAQSFMSDEKVETGAMRSLIRYQPIGAILAVMPWNFPFWQVFRFAAPTLMAGNVGLLKHASNVPGSALAIEKLLSDAGFPEGVFQTLVIPAKDVEQVIASPHVAAATLTGGEPAGCALAVGAGKRLKKTVLELGGSDPFIVMPSADLGKAVEAAVKARIINNGQSCICAKRFIVADAIAAQFEQRFVAAFEKLKIGDPMDPANDVGPLATEQVLDSLDQQVQQSAAQGARILTGGRRLPGPGFYYAPTVLTDIPTSSPAYSEELFGPVASVFRVSSIDEAIRIANDTEFGLASSVWTHDPAEQDRFTSEIQAGAVFVNAMVVSDPRLPFGGIKRSGYGRELGLCGIREFVNVKTVCTA
jgi:succinate-semialdehyde dehydrogenase/glutarate-semialdehyde dehydrogenase